MWKHFDIKGENELIGGGVKSFCFEPVPDRLLWHPYFHCVFISYEFYFSPRHFTLDGVFLYRGGSGSLKCTFWNFPTETKVLKSRQGIFAQNCTKRPCYSRPGLKKMKNYCTILLLHLNAMTSLMPGILVILQRNPKQWEN